MASLSTPFAFMTTATTRIRPAPEGVTGFGEERTAGGFVAAVPDQLPARVNAPALATCACAVPADARNASASAATRPFPHLLIAISGTSVTLCLIPTRALMQAPILAGEAAGAHPRTLCLGKSFGMATGWHRRAGGAPPDLMRSCAQSPNPRKTCA